MYTDICTDTPGPHSYGHEHTSYPTYSSFCLVVFSCLIVAACSTTFLRTHLPNKLQFCHMYEWQKREFLAILILVAEAYV